MSNEQPDKQLSKLAAVTVVASFLTACGAILRLSARWLSSDIRRAYNERTYSSLTTPFDPLRYQLLVEVAAVLMIAGLALAVLATHHWLLAKAEAGRAG